jgi:hypothetical protein
LTPSPIFRPSPTFNKRINKNRPGFPPGDESKLIPD